jgi:sterol 14-demethylase
VGNAPDFRRDPIALLRRGYEQFGPVFSIRLGARRAAVVVGPAYQRVMWEEADRAIIQSAVSPARMPGFLRVIIDRTQTRLDLLGAAGEFELWDTIQELCLEASCGLMGTDFRRRMQPDFWRLYRDLAGALGSVLAPRLPLPTSRRGQRALRIVDERIAAMIADRRASPGAHDDFTQTLAEARSNTGELLPIERLRNIILLLLSRATETTPLQASLTLIQLLQHPDSLARAIEEQDAVLGRASAITVDSLAGLNRLQRAIQETERLRPAIAMSWRHITEECEIDGYRVPRGWAAVICPPLPRRPPDVFDSPDAYDPERFSSPPAEDRGVSDFTMKAIFSLLLLRYELRLATPDRLTPCPTGTTRPGACTVRYTKRVPGRVAPAHSV